MTGQKQAARGQVVRFRRFVKARGAVAALCCVVTAAGIWRTGPVHAEMPSEYSVKAAYINSFLKFVEWPASVTFNEGSTLTLCSLGGGPLNTAIGALNGRTVQNRTLAVRPVLASDDLSGCHVLVLGGARFEQSAALMKKISQPSLLTVGESPNFARDVGVIGFVIIDDRVNLQINLERAQDQNLRLSAQLLEVAEHVYRKAASP